MRLKLTVRARLDLRAIGDFIALDNPRRAVSFVRELRAACAGLLEAPERFASLQGNYRYPYKRRVYGQYLIIYRIIQDQVLIARIVSAAVDLTDDPPVD